MIKAYMVDAITIVRHAVLDVYNEPGTATLEETTAYVDWGSRLVRNLQGEQVVASASVMMEYDATLTHEDKIRIDAVDHVILRIERMKDFTDRGMMVYVA
jgi:hypothetical protein